MVRHSYQRLNSHPKVMIGDDNNFDVKYLDTSEKLNGNDPEHLHADNLTSIYQGEWPLNKVLWNSAPSSIGEKGSLSGLLAMDTSSMISFSSSLSAAPTSRRINTHHLGTKVEMVYSLLSLLGTRDKEDMSEHLLAMSKSPDSCIAMRQSGCLPLLVQLLHCADDSKKEVRARAGTALHNIVHAHADDKRGRRETRVLRLLEQIRDYCDRLRGRCPMVEDCEQHPGQAVAVLMKLSFDEEHRNAMCQLGGLYAIAELIHVDNEVHGNTADQFCVTLRRYAGMALTNLTFGDGTNKALLCSMRPFMRSLVGQLSSPNEDLRQVTASVLRNLSWRADSGSKQILREVGAVGTLVVAAMEASKESTLKSILSALWNLSAHCSGNKADICAVPGALAFLVETLNYKSPAIVENGGGILRNVSSHVAVHEEHRRVLREHGCLQILLQHLRSSSLTVVSNACGTLWNLSARCEQDQTLLWEMGAVAMLRNLVNSKHKMISMGSSAALKNLLSSKPAGTAFVQRAHSSSANGVPSLLVRKQRALEEELDQNLSETCDNLDSPKTSPTRHSADHPPPYFTYLPGRMYHSMSGGHPYEVPRSESRESVGSTRSEPPYPLYRKQFYHSFSRTDRRTRCPVAMPQRLTVDVDPLVGNWAADCESKVASQDEPIDYSFHFNNSSRCKFQCPPAPKVNNYFQDGQVSGIGLESDLWQHPKNALYPVVALPIEGNSSFDNYAETDLDDPDQPTDYSQKYKEHMETSEDYEPSDTVKVYHTEGTPLTFSTASSLSDLRDSGPDCYDRKPTKPAVPPPIRESYFQGTSKQKEVKKIEMQHKRADGEGTAPKSVTFGEEVNYAEETPLMYSRCSSLGSLSSFDQHSIHDDRSSVISDFSRRASEVVSPSDLPDSPSQTMPTSPRRPPKQQTTFVFEGPPHVEYVEAEDTCKVYAEEGTPANPSGNASVLSFIVDEESKPLKSIDEVKKTKMDEQDVQLIQTDSGSKIHILRGKPSCIKKPGFGLPSRSHEKESDEQLIRDCLHLGRPGLPKEPESISPKSNNAVVESNQKNLSGAPTDEELIQNCLRLGRPGTKKCSSGLPTRIPSSEGSVYHTPEDATDEELIQNCIRLGRPGSKISSNRFGIKKSNIPNKTFSSGDCSDQQTPDRLKSEEVADEELIMDCIRLGRPGTTVNVMLTSGIKKPGYHSPKRSDKVVEDVPVSKVPVASLKKEEVQPSRRIVTTHACGFAHGSSHSSRSHRRASAKSSDAAETNKSTYNREPRNQRVTQLSRLVDSTRDLKSSYHVEDTPTVFSQNSSLSSLSFDSEGEIEQAAFTKKVSCDISTKNVEAGSSSVSSLSAEYSDEPSPYERALLQELMDLGKPKSSGKDNRRCEIAVHNQNGNASETKIDREDDDNREEKGKEDERTREKDPVDEMTTVMTLQNRNAKVFVSSSPPSLDELRLEARNILDKLEADEECSISLSELDNVKPPSVMGDLLCLSTTSSGLSDSFSERRRCGKSLVRRSKNSSSDLLDNVDLPSATFDLPRTASCTSLNSIGSDILEENNKSSSGIFDRLDAAASMVNIYSRELSNIMNGSSSGASEVIDRVLPPSAFAEVTLEDFASSDTEMEELPKDDFSTSETPRAVSLLRRSENEEDGSTENVCTLVEEEDERMRAELQHEANLVVTTLHQMRQADQCLNLGGDNMLEDETMSLISNESDLEQEEEEDQNGNQSEAVQVARGPRIIKPVNRDAVKAMRESKKAPQPSKGKEVKGTRASALRSKNDCKNPPKPVFGTFTRSREDKKSQSDGENRPKPPIKQGTFTKESPTGSPKRIPTGKTTRSPSSLSLGSRGADSLPGSRSASNVSLSSASSSAGKKATTSGKKEVASRIAVLWKKSPSPNKAFGIRTAKTAVSPMGLGRSATKRCESA